MSGREQRGPGTAGIIIGIAAVVLLGLYFIFDPSETRWAPKCMFHTMTGLDCPGCGSQRMVHALLHGRWGEAWHQNAMLLVMTPLLLLMAYSAVLRRKMLRLYAVLNSPAMIVGITALLIAWTVVRNLITI